MFGYNYNGIRSINMSNALYAINNINTTANVESALSYTATGLGSSSISIVSTGTSGARTLTNSIIQLPNSTSVYDINIMINIDAWSGSTVDGYITLFYSSNSGIITQWPASYSYTFSLLADNSATIKTKMLYSAANGQYIYFIINSNSAITSSTSVWSRIQITEIGL